MEPPCFHGKSELEACLCVVPLCVRPGSGHPAAGPVAEALLEWCALPGGSVSVPELLLGSTLVRGRAGIQTLVCLILSRCPFCCAKLSVAWAAIA